MSTITAPQYSAATIARCETILHNAGIATIDATVLRAVAATVKADRTPIAPEAGFYAEPSIAAAPSKRTVKRAPVAKGHSAAKRAQMSTKKASIGQMNRINDVYAEQGLREFKTLASFRKVFPTMLAASDEYASLKA